MLMYCIFVTKYAHAVYTATHRATVVSSMPDTGRLQQLLVGYNNNISSEATLSGLYGSGGAIQYEVRIQCSGAAVTSRRAAAAAAAE